RPGTVDFQEFYEKVDKMWRPGSFGVDDVCIAYKDRQWATQRPNPNIPFWTTHDGSAMGGGFGIGLGAKVANPDLHTFVFTGDGCFRLFGGALADAANLDLRVFVVNNEVYGIVDKGLEVIIPDYDKKNYHSKLPHIDFVKHAEAHGWDAVRIAPDLSNLKDTMDAAYERKGRSRLIDLPVDADVVALLVPDQHHKEAFEKIAPFLGKGRTLLVAHAFSIHFGEVKPNAETDVVMIAPKAPGHRMREVFKEGKGVPALIAVYQDASGQAEKTALAYARGVGATRAGVIKTTFAEEVETDWFGEQVILCGGISELMKASFETLVEAGYQPEVAYFECVN